MKKICTKVFAAFIVVLFSISCFGCGIRGGINIDEINSAVRDVQRSDVKYEDMVFIKFDDTNLQNSIDSLNEAVEQERGEEEIRNLLIALIEEKGRLDDAYLHLMVDYYTDTTNEEKLEKYSSAGTQMTFITDDVYVAVARVLNSKYESVATEVIDSKYVQRLKDYEEIKPEEIALYEEIDELQRQYNEYYSGNVDIEIVYNGKIFTWEDFDSYEKFDDYNELVDVYYALYEKECSLMGEIILKQVKLRNEIARIEGYDNYYEMMWEDGYYREYTYEDFEKAASYIKEYLCEDINYLNYLGYEDYEECEDCDFDLNSFYERLLEEDTLEENAREAVEYIKEYNLFLLADEDDYNVGFSTKFETYNEPFIYLLQQRDEYALESLLSLAHETGHAVNFYYDNSNSISSAFSDLEIAEVQSTAFPLLYMDAISDMYPECKDAIQRRIVANAVSTLQNCGFQAEVEHMLYTNEGKDIQEINHLAAEIAKEYKYYDVMFDEECVSWSMIPHYSDSPGYVVSYVMSSLGSLSLWQKLQAGDSDILSVYDALLTEDNANINYKELTKKYDMNNIYKENFYKTLKKYVEKYA